MKRIKFLSNIMGLPRHRVAAVVFMLAAFGGAAEAQFDLTVNMTAFLSAHEGQLFKLRVVNVATGLELGEYINESIVADNFTTVFSSMLKSDESYNIDAFADYSGNRLYDPPPLDHAWRITLTGVTADTAITVMHTSQWMDIRYPNPGDEPAPVPADTCGCDLTGDGRADTGDLLEWITLVLSRADNPCLDYNRDSRQAVDDLLGLLIDIRAGGCLQP